MSYVVLSTWDVVLAAGLLLAAGALSIAFRLGLVWPLALATLRMVLQIAAIGLALKAIVEQSSLSVTLLAAAALIVLAAAELAMRQTSGLPRMAGFGVGALTLLVAGFATTFYVSLAVVGQQPWWAPRVFLPILGLILGQALTGVALVLETMAQAAKHERGVIEARLALGQKPMAALHGVVARAMRAGLAPPIAAMGAAGFVSLPGVLSGQVLVGVDPVEAAKYQIMVLFATVGATALASLLAALGCVRLMTDDRQRLRLDRLGGG